MNELPNRRTAPACANYETGGQSFWRAGSHSGSGLGLAIVRRLVEADGGSAELVARAEGGIDAVVRMPRACVPAPSQPRASA